MSNSFVESINIQTDERGRHTRWAPHPEDPGCIVSTPIKPDLENSDTKVALTGLWVSTYDLLSQVELRNQTLVKAVHFSPDTSSDGKVFDAATRQPSIPRPAGVKVQPAQFFVAKLIEDGNYSVRASLAHTPDTRSKLKSVVVNHATFLIGANLLSLTDLHRDFYSLPDFQGNVKTPQFTPAVLRPHVAIKGLTKCINVLYSRFTAVPTPAREHGPASEWRIT